MLAMHRATAAEGGSSPCLVEDRPLPEGAGAGSQAGSTPSTGSRGFGQPLTHGSAGAGEQIG